MNSNRLAAGLGVVEREVEHRQERTLVDLDVDALFHLFVRGVSVRTDGSGFANQSRST